MAHSPDRSLLKAMELCRHDAADVEVSVCEGVPPHEATFQGAGPCSFRLPASMPKIGRRCLN